MAATAVLTASVSERLRKALEALAGISSAIIDSDRGAIFLICDLDAEGGPPEPGVRSLIAEEGIPEEKVRVEFLTQQVQGVRRRVRFRSVERTPIAPGVVRIDAALEWQGKEYLGSATGESGAAIELRTAAAATIEAVRTLLGPEIGLRLTGIKQIRAFDTDLVITSIHRSAPPHQHFVGATIVGDDPLRSASVSVLHALNRMLGNFLATSD